MGELGKVERQETEQDRSGIGAENGSSTMTTGTVADSRSSRSV